MSIAVLQSLFQEAKEEKILPNSFYKAVVTIHQSQTKAKQNKKVIIDQYISLN